MIGRLELYRTGGDARRPDDVDDHIGGPRLEIHGRADPRGRSVLQLAVMFDGCDGSAQHRLLTAALLSHPQVWESWLASLSQVRLITPYMRDDPPKILTWPEIQSRLPYEQRILERVIGWAEPNPRIAELARPCSAGAISPDRPDRLRLAHHGSSVPRRWRRASDAARDAASRASRSTRRARCSGSSRASHSRILACAM